MHHGFRRIAHVTSPIAFLILVVLAGVTAGGLARCASAPDQRLAGSPATPALAISADPDECGKNAGFLAPEDLPPGAPSDRPRRMECKRYA